MRIMGIRGVAPGPDTSKPHPENKIYPYLLRGLLIDKVNQVWSTDITYIPMTKGFMYLVALYTTKNLKRWHSSLKCNQISCFCFGKT
jgi:putative transposase